MTVYLDNAATSWPKPEAVYRAVDGCLRTVGANPGRSGHRLSLEAGRLVEDARSGLARLFNVSDSSRFILAFSATDALNMALKGTIRPGDHVVTSSMEHNSVMRPLSSMSRAGVISLTTVGATREGLVTPGSVLAALKDNTRLVILTHASNVVGTINPVEEISGHLHERGITFLVDAAQTVGIVPIDLSAMPVDLMAFAGHKGLLGPQGTGGLYVKEGVTVAPWREGGTGNQSHLEFQPLSMPERLEAGTHNTPGLAGLAAGVEYLLETGVAVLRQREEQLMKAFLENIEDIRGLRVLGPRNSESTVGIVSLLLEGIDPADLALALDSQYGILTRPGLHCAPGAHRSLGSFPGGTLRLSIGPFTTREDLRLAWEALRRLAG